MAEELKLNKSLSDEEIYFQLKSQLNYLILSDEPIISGMANFSAALKQAFDKISWAGFYLAADDKLFLGPFAGNTACVEIQIGKGVCGTAAEKLQTVIVEDVDKFPGHIACDSGSRSEIVVPLISGGNLVGVLDLDSYSYSAFNGIDKKYLEDLSSDFISKFDFSNFSIK